MADEILDDSTGSGGEASFNMALATLEAIRKILDEIKLVSAGVGQYIIFDENKRQEIKLDLTKSLYLNCSSLLDEDTSKRYKEILDYKPVQARSYCPTSVGKEFRGIVNKFDYALDKKLNEASLNLQLELQRKGFIMPKKSDPRFALRGR